MKTQLDILEMDKEEIIAIDPDDVEHELSKIEIIHLFKELGGYLEFDYGTLENGNPDDHYKLKSEKGVELCSDIFFDSKAVLRYENIRKIFAKQLVNKNQDKAQSNLDWGNPTCVAGIPTGATLLGEDVADILKARKIDLVKQNGNIEMKSTLELNETLLFVEDICKRGTAPKESENAVMENNPSGIILPFVLVIINRGRLSKIRADSGFIFNIISLCSVKTNEWDKYDCELCRMGSKRIKPNETERN